MSLVQLGTICYINNVNSFTSFNADLVERYTEPHTLVRNLTKIVGGHAILHGYENYSIGLMNLKFYVYGDGSTDVEKRTSSEKNASKLINAMNECVLTFSDDSFQYPAGVTEYTIANTGINEWTEVNVKVACVKRLASLSTTISGTTGTIINEGSIKSGAKITATISSGSFSMTDMSGKQISCSGLDNGTLIINGLEGSIKLNNVNVFNKTNIYEFPIIVPGVNTIYFSQANCTIEYYPLFLL